MHIKKTSNEYILKGNIYAGLVKLALPLMLLNIINTAYSLVDTYFVGKINELDVGAVSLIAPIVGCANACIAGLCAAAIALIARALGENNTENANNAANQIFDLGCVLGIVLGAFLMLFRDPILIWLETPEEIYESTKAYLTGIAFDSLFVFILSYFQSVKQAAGNTTIGVVLNVCSCLLNCILDPIFIIWLNLGTFGAAIATMLSKALICPIAIAILRNKNAEVYITKGIQKFEKGLMWKVIKISAPATIGQFLASFGFVLMSKEIVSYGAIIMSAYGIGNQISSLFYIPINVMGSALTTFIGQNLGDNNPDRAKECYRKNMSLVAVFSLLCTILGFFLAPMAIHLFIKNASEKLVSEALTYAYYSIFTSFFMGWFMSLLGVFNGSGNTLISMILSSCRLFVVRIPIIYLFARFTNLEHIGIWIAMIVSNLIICVSGQILYNKFPWTTRGIKL